jgi:hypothetical protein
VDVLRTWMKLGAAALVGSLAVAACGTVHLGAAAIIGNQRVSSTTLSAQVSNLNAGYQQYRSKTQLQYPASEMPQQVLGWIVRFRVRDRLAQREHISVTQTEVQQGLAEITASIRQSGNYAPLAAVGVANGLPPDMLTQLGQYEAIETKLLDKLDGGKTPASSSAQLGLENRFNRSQCLAAKSLAIQINPQYGVLDYSDFSVVPAPNTLSKPQSGSSSSTKVELTPPC